MEKHTLYISIGTNLPTAEQVLNWTKRKLSEAFRGEALYSTAVKTDPIKMPKSPQFTNQVVRIVTTVPKAFAKPLLKSIERQLGRTDEDKSRQVVRVDLDILCSDGEIIKPEDWERDYIKAAVEEIGQPLIEPTE